MTLQYDTPRGHCQEVAYASRPPSGMGKLDPQVRSSAQGGIVDLFRKIVRTSHRPYASAIGQRWIPQPFSTQAQERPMDSASHHHTKHVFVGEQIKDWTAVPVFTLKHCPCWSVKVNSLCPLSFGHPPFSNIVTQWLPSLTLKE